MGYKQCNRLGEENIKKIYILFIFPRSTADTGFLSIFNSSITEPIFIEEEEKIKHYHGFVVVGGLLFQEQPKGPCAAKLKKNVKTMQMKYHASVDRWTSKLYKNINESLIGLHNEVGTIPDGLNISPIVNATIDLDCLSGQIMDLTNCSGILTGLSALS